MKKMKTCWICRRTEEELKKEDVVEGDGNKLNKLKETSGHFENNLFVCNVCEEVIWELLLKERTLAFKAEIQESIEETLEKISKLILKLRVGVEE